jgi:hypothetical protein
MNFRPLLALTVAALLTASSAYAQTATPTAAPVKPAKPVTPPPPPPTGAEVGKAIDAMVSSCAKALELQTEIAASAARRKTAQASRTKSNAELKKKLRAVKLAKKKVEGASKKPGANAAPMADAAKADYEAALAESKTVEVETQSMQAAEDQLLKLVTSAEEASASCAKYEEAVRTAATVARKAVQNAKRNAAKARALAALRAGKALEAARAQQTKELVAIKTDTETARTELEALKAEAAKQPPPTAKPLPATASPVATEKKKAAEHGKSAEPHGKAAEAQNKPK